MFDHRELGTTESTWNADGRLAGAAALSARVQGDHLIVVAAHPDDETLGAGGLIATAGAAGVRTDVIIASDGEASHPGSATHTGERLAALRRVEVISAVATLNVAARVTHLGLADGLLSHQRELLEAAINQLVTAGSLLVTPWRGDRHPDHEACALAASAIVHGQPGCEQWEYPIWTWHWADPSQAPWSWDALGRVDLEQHAVIAKQAAIAAHHSQNRPLSDLAGDEAILHDSFLEHFRRPYEIFVLEDSSVAPREAQRAIEGSTA